MLLAAYHGDLSWSRVTAILSSRILLECCAGGIPVHLGFKTAFALAFTGALIGFSVRATADPLKVKTEQGKVHGKLINDGGVAPGRSQAERRDDGLLDELCKDRRSQRAGTAGVAAVRQNRRADSPGHNDYERAGDGAIAIRIPDRESARESAVNHGARSNY